MERVDESMSAQPLIDVSPDRALRLEFEELLYREAWLLDHERFDEWLELMALDVRYWVPVRLDQARGKENLSRQCLMAHIDENHQGLVYRIRRIQTGATFTDEPPARVRHFVSNVLVTGADKDSCSVASNFLVWRSHVGVKDYMLVGSREDTWRRDGSSWKLKERRVILDHSSVPGLSVLF
jgi:3-phenylpropionate/cinnamic acid dioxygenase small subunit